jgi:hypothetical protein
MTREAAELQPFDVAIDTNGTAKSLNLGAKQVINISALP